MTRCRRSPRLSVPFQAVSQVLAAVAVPVSEAPRNRPLAKLIRVSAFQSALCGSYADGAQQNWVFCQRSESIYCRPRLRRAQVPLWVRVQVQRSRRRGAMTTMPMRPTPLRRVHLATWSTRSRPRRLLRKTQKAHTSSKTAMTIWNTPSESAVSSLEIRKDGWLMHQEPL